MKMIDKVSRTIKAEIWWTVTVLVLVMMVVNVTSLSGPNVCMVKQKYNITKRVKYRAPMSVRTYEWCFAMPPRCSKWNTEMRDVTRLETEERTAEMAVCCPGYKLRDVSCVPNCPSGKTGQGCLDDCPSKKWGPSCVHECKQCVLGSCDAVTGACRCQDGWQGESCETSMTTTAAAAMIEQLLTTETPATKTNTQAIPSTTRSHTVTSTYKTNSTSNLTTTSDTKSTNKSTPDTKTSFSYKYFIETTIVTVPTTKVTQPAQKNTKESTNSLTIQKFKKFVNESLSTVPMNTLNTNNIVKEIENQSTTNRSNYNRTELPAKTEKVKSSVKIVTAIDSTSTKFDDVEISTLATVNISKTKMALVYQRSTKSSNALATTTVKAETQKTPTTSKQPMTTKYKPKEIWIKPAQKGELPTIEETLKLNQELPLSKLKLKEVVEITTPKTIIVSIIPTSVSYVTFRKIVLTTASAMAQKHNISIAIYSNKTTNNQESTMPMIVSTTASPLTIKVLRKPNMPSNESLLHHNVTKVNSYNVSTTTRSFSTVMPTTRTSNSMSSMLNVSYKRLNSSLLTTASLFSTNATKTTSKSHPLSESTTSKTAPMNVPDKHKITVTEKIAAENITAQTQSITITRKNVTKPITDRPVTKTFIQKQAEVNIKRNLTFNNTTDDPTRDEETFPILTEPEHITAVMGDKGNERTTYNLISVISIAGGVMMAIITVAIVIVMLERCRRPRYEDVRKYNDIRMQVMIDNNDVPPPYVRSIFHTPLPDPPTSEKCHYQPISTLDRNLKQFMRPVVVQTISPLMLENFRGILECHYDHLPRRSQDMGTLPTRCSVAPSVDEREEFLPPPRIHSLTDSDIEAMKCEAKLDVIDNTTSEPLYAEIPCWRPTSAHAIEVVNLNGEAVTEL